MDCLFCKIAAGTIPAKRLYEDDKVLAFPDLHPQAPTHILLIPKRHIDSMAAATTTDLALLGYLLSKAATIAEQEGLGLTQSMGQPGGGYRLVINTGPDGGQTVNHLHVHLLGGRSMGWPPG